ncbi:MAG: glycosyltransferase family 2 protein, partial [Chitinophagaceae bacterium]
MESQKNNKELMSNPLVSILVPMYNSAATITETVESCVKQEYGNVEVIIVDDSSKDDSFAVAERLAEQYPNVHA